MAVFSIPSSVGGMERSCMERDAAGALQAPHSNANISSLHQNAPSMRNIKVDQSICSGFEEHSKQRGAPQVGLLIGSIGSDTRDSILAVIPTPSFEEGQQAIEVSGSATDLSKKGKGSKPSQEPRVRINAEWIVEHASQVAPLVPGGLRIVGFFTYAPEAALPASTTQLCRILLSLRSCEVLTGDAALLTVSAPGGRLAVKELPVSASGAEVLKSCDCRAAPVLSSYISVHTMYRLGAACTVRSTGEQLQDHLRGTIQAEKDAVAMAIVCLETGRLPDEGAALMDLGSQGAGMLKAQMLTPPACCADSGQQGNEAHGRTALRGVITARALVHSRDRWSAAVAALKGDLQRSLDARLNVLLTDAEEADAGHDDAQSPLMQQGAAVYGSLQSCCLPQRAFLPAQAPLVYSDYCLYGKDAAQALSTAHEVLNLPSILEDQVEWPEQAASQQHPGLWDPLAAQARPAMKHSEMPHKAASAPTYHQYYLTLGLSAAGALAVALAAAWLYVGS